MDSLGSGDSSIPKVSFLPPGLYNRHNIIMALMLFLELKYVNVIRNNEPKNSSLPIKHPSTCFQEEVCRMGNWCQAGKYFQCST